jgi:ATPase subunit of ABC transporter with duplicated ATPase domains
MIIISHDRHFLNMVCTHMADLDYGELRVYPGNYDEYMTAATQARERLLADNAKKKRRLPTCNPSLAASAPTPLNRVRPPRARQIDKIKLEEVKASSRQNPFIRFEQDKKLFRNALEVEALAKALMKVRCSKTSTCCWKWARRLPFWAPTAWVNPRAENPGGELQPTAA